MSAREDPKAAVPALLARLGGGDEVAARELLTRYLDDLKAYVHARAGRDLLAKEPSADIVQSVCREVLEDAANGAFAYRDEPRFRAFLFRAALNKIRGKGRFHARERRSARHEVGPGGSDGSTAEALFHTLRTPSRSAAEKEERERFVAAFALLNEQQRTLIQWSYLDGLPHREIAARLAISETYSRTLLARALARLASLATD